MAASVLVLDIDGTLADLSAREHFADEGMWDEFFEPERVYEDEPIALAQKSLPKILLNFDKLYVLTGRPQRLKSVTREWLSDYFNLEPGDYKIFMRRDEDMRPSQSVKKTIIENFFSDKYAFTFIDDDASNLQVLSDYGEAYGVPEAWNVLMEDESEEDQEYG